MNGERRKKYRPRQCQIPEEYLKELGEELTKRYMAYGEIIAYIKQRCHKRYDLENIIGVMESRGYLIAEERQPVKYGFKIFFTVMTKEKYEKIEEEHRENAKRRLLAAISY